MRWLQSVDAVAHEFRFIVFNLVFPSFDPSIATINLHLWNGFDSFSDHPRTGDLVIPSNQIARTVSPFSVTGPTGVEFPTWEIRWRLSELASPILLEAGQEYVLAPVVIHDNLFFQYSAPPQFIGLDDVVALTHDQLIVGVHILYQPPTVNLRQFGASLTVTPLLPGDYDFDGDVDGADYAKWRSTYTARQAR